MLELAADKVPDLMASKHYEGGRTTAAVAFNNGFSFARSRLGCYCSPPPGGSCSHVGWNPCEENGGTGWTARVLRVEEGNCLLAFPHSRTATGLAFADEWLSCAAVRRSPHQPSLPFRRGPSLADLRRARPADREAGPECPSNVGGTSASHRTAHSPGAAGDPTPRIAKCVRLAVLLNSCQAVAGMSVPHRATAPLPEPASQSAPVMLLALVVAALAAALWRTAVIASAGDSTAPTTALVASPPPVKLIAQGSTTAPGTR
ncbi:hypothetical protein EMIHUDRAFT_251610 [Emiliania huxleyi CCMP1516]|uniref:Uncharacterized protein n=2 Tax=Emiliania huxleyi TaxID=2903 RepID=A0A0D3KGR7_EMIH1|nr:hypothetical protein EMIHUDRAFT_227970 [Emiliania huxleyi CCMP1516]XP_005791367.1 hypothetical protein EMIHUDRAFT_251610 [Emiliania huxleyi CCMP1516]EOD34952.1 hypothetical protein EMIHUDRAFT_227970 [Emiliania huxleyi CCMP1516]EOD38938.1 hypothetical protein EMIHUDRAFT_251610 [Emiliania huxleyi CCMP1516]|eukprot:XP_005787381.1 hypothetical protein EMIHUDRAFT_227970 [Emiliania huxleyi CCMP1516]